MLKFKVDILAALRDVGYNSTRIRNEAVLSQSTLQKLRSTGQLSWGNIDTLCRLLKCQPGDLLEYVPDEPAPPPLESDLLSEENLRRLISKRLNEQDDI